LGESKEKMKRITLRADEAAIARAHEAARTRHTTLNAAFREWLKEFVARGRHAREIGEILERTSYLKAGRKYTREELNER
jgi:hypothetical protein